MTMLQSKSGYNTNCTTSEQLLITRSLHSVLVTNYHRFKQLVEMRSTSWLRQNWWKSVANMFDSIIRYGWFLHTNHKPLVIKSFILLQQNASDSLLKCTRKKSSTISHLPTNYHKFIIELPLLQVLMLRNRLCKKLTFSSPDPLG